MQSEEPLAPFLRNPTSVTELLDLAFEMDVQVCEMDVLKAWFFWLHDQTN